MSPPNLQPGYVVAGKYQLHGAIGNTGLTAVYSAGSSDGRQVALKVYSPLLAQQGAQMELLSRFHAGGTSLPQEMTVRVLDAGYDSMSSAPYVVTDLLQTPHLAQTVATRPMSADVVVQLVNAIATILDGAHGLGLFHLSLRPTNVFIAGTSVRLSDWGEVAVLMPIAPQSELARWAPFLAPEQATPATPTGAATDIYSLAILAFFALTGRAPWRAVGPNGSAEPSAWLAETGVPFSIAARAQELGTMIPAGFDPVFAQAMQMNPAARFPTARAFADALQGALYAPAIQAAQTGIGAGLPRPGEMSATVPIGAMAGDFGIQNDLSEAEPPPPKKSKAPLIIGLVVGLLLVFAVIGGAVAMFVLRKPDVPAEPVAASASPEAVPAPPPEPSASASAEPATEAPPAGSASAAPPADAVPGEATLTVTCDPACDEIKVDGKDASGAVPVAKGKHTIVASKAGYIPQTSHLVIKDAEPVTVNLTLKEKPKETGGTGAKKPCGTFVNPCK